jgi:hypothetical protein
LLAVGTGTFILHVPAMLTLFRHAKPYRGSIAIVLVLRRPR